MISELSPFFEASRPQYISLKTLQKIRLLGIILLLTQFLINVANVPLSNQLFMISHQGNWAALISLSISYAKAADLALIAGIKYDQANLILVELLLLYQPELTIYYWTVQHSYIVEKIQELVEPSLQTPVFIAQVCLHTLPCIFACADIIFTQCRFKVGHWRIILLYIMCYTGIYITGCEIRGKWIYPFLPWPEKKFYPHMGLAWLTSVFGYILLANAVNILKKSKISEAKSL
ncbi:hypothetical protein FGO68_gene3065 [Halteria grandinella]|uniref:Uncharacterized protein n=1 Tax=Halteria grandinella TaxID=5974 RepID=A0A8J8NJM9_HALGN|nr:hypothetical protein FGO68_gene3065 [Halteria grandinella]